jgi:gamma-glutamyltranspeptidase/glutathione hydrolase
MNFWQANRNLRVAAVVWACSFSLLAMGQSANVSDLARLPDEPKAYTPQKGWATKGFAVASAHPLATQAGYEILNAGGSAIDAAVAIQMVLTLVEPQSSGIGGGSFILHHDGMRIEAYDGRETAPAAATENLFLDVNGHPIDFKEALASGLSVGVPGTLSVLELAHQAHGKLPWSRLVQPAIDLAVNGFKISPRLHATLLATPELKNDATARDYFFDAMDRPYPVGHLLKNPELAQVLKAVAERGSQALKEGPWAQAIVNKVGQHPQRPGAMTLQDLAQYKAKKREALCFDYSVKQTLREFKICSFPPPSSGALAIGQILGILNHTPAVDMPLKQGLPSSDWLHFYNESAKLAYADRAQFVADPDFVAAPGGQWQNLLSPNYLLQRSRLIGSQSMQSAMAGQPSPQPRSWAPMPYQTEYGTSHISVIDQSGRALAMTSTIEASFGAKLMVNTGQGLAGGFLLNNELTDFSFVPKDVQGLPIANRVEPGKRPRSSMSPTLVFDKATSQLKMSGGSPGGGAIIHFTTKLLVGTLNWNLTVQEAIDLPNFSNLNGPSFLEENRFPQATIKDLKNKGHEVIELPMPSGLQAIEVTPSGFFGGADPRREGKVMGPPH